MDTDKARAFNERVFSQVINLDRSPDRLATITEYLNAAHIEFTRFSAYDGKLMDLDNDPLVTSMFDLKMWVKRHHRNPIPADVGCYLSNFKAIETFLGQSKPFGLIFEDDADFKPDFIDRVAPALEDTDSWDILKLHARHPGPLIARRVYDEQSTLSSFVTKHAGSTTYMVNRKAAERMLKHMVPAVRMIDWVYDEGHRMDLKVRTIAPMPVSLQPVPSTIETDRKKMRKSWIEKHADKPLAPRWSLPFRRFTDDVHRVSFNLIADGGLAALLTGPKR